MGMEISDHCDLSCPGCAPGREDDPNQVTCNCGDTPVIIPPYMTCAQVMANAAPTIENLRCRYPGLSMAAIGVILVADLCKEKMDASIEMLEFLQMSVSKKLHENTVKTNNLILETIKNTENNNNAGIGPSGQIIQTDNSILPDWLKSVIEGIITIGIIIICVVCPPLGLGILFVLIIISSIVLLAINIAKSAGAKGEWLDTVAYFAQMLNPVYDMVDLFMEGIECIIEASGDEKALEWFKKWREIITAVIVLIIEIILTVGFKTLLAPLEIAETVQKAIAIATIVEAVGSMVSAVFTILEGVKNLDKAEQIYALKLLELVIDNLRDFIGMIQDQIKEIIEGLSVDIEAMKTEFDMASEMIKIEWDTKATVARNITI